MRRLWKTVLSVLHPDQCTICGGWPDGHIGKCPRR
jgi:hypothetical protein